MPTSKIVRARTLKRCAQPSWNSTCTGWIYPGERYERITVFPSDDLFAWDVPVRMAVCCRCKDVQVGTPAEQERASRADEAEALDSAL